jgi:TonB-linked SusC/RagA family outer membrane protein
MSKTFTQPHYFKKSVVSLALLLALTQLPLHTYSASLNSISTQQRQEGITVSGIILDDADGLPLPGVTIMDSNRKVLGTTTATGSYLVRSSKGAVVTFTMLGYTSTTRTFNADKEKINIRLKVSSNELNEVVVTALGIRREAKALGYSATVLKGEQLTEAISNNWTDALSGKVAGLNLVRSNAGPAGSNKIILRGENNLTGDNEALIIVDGVMISQGSGRKTGIDGTGGYLDSDSPADYGSSINDINPEDIETVTVLKGPGASALYGQRGANGAIIVTTKSGNSKKKGVGVTINSNTSIESINRWPDLQYEYGQGLDGADYYSFGATADGPSTRSTSSAWGPKFNGQSYFQYDPVTHTGSTTRTPWVPYVNDSRSFFETGRTYTNSVSLQGGNEKTSARFSATNVQNSWIIPNTGYDRTSIALSVDQKVSEKLKISSKINYNNKKSDNLPNGGYNNQSIMYWYMFWEPSAPVDWLKDYWLPGKEGVSQSYPFSSLPDNPYLITNEMKNKTNRNALTGNVSATYNFTKELSLLVRTSMDFSYDRRSQQRPYDTERFKKGMYRTQNIFSQELNSDFLIRYAKDVTKDINITATGGGSMIKNNYTRDELRVDSLLYPGVYTLANGLGVVSAYKPYRGQYNLNSFYGLLSSSYKNYLFLDVTARNDWNSVLATPLSTDNSSFFYSSLNGSLILSELFKLPKAVNYAKVRASYSGVGSGRNDPYLTTYSYEVATGFQGGLQNQTLLANLNLKPLFTTSLELGAEARFLNNRLGFDLAVYQGNTKDQILSATVDRSSGAAQALVNAGEVRNKGIEIAANGVPVKTHGGLTWNVNATFAANRNRVISLTDSLPQLVLRTGPANRGAVIAIPGGSMGDLYGRGYVRSPDGEIVYENGLPQITTDMKYLGNTSPQWKASLNNEFIYKQFKVSFLVDAQYGAVGYSLTNAVLAEGGKSTATLPGRYNGIIGKGVIRNTDGTFRPNDVIAEDVPDYYLAHYGRDNVEGNTYSTDFLKLREARFDYTLSPKLTKRLGLQRAVIGVFGRDLLTVTNWPAFDPEFGTLNGSEITQGFELGQFPSTRTLGLNIVISL